MDWTRQVKTVLRLPRKKRDGVEVEAGHMADGQGRGDAGGPDPEAEDVPPGREAEDPGLETDTVQRLNVLDRDRGKGDGAVVGGGREVREGLEEVVVGPDPVALDPDPVQGNGRKRRSQRKIKIEIRIGIRTGLRIRIIRRTGMKVIPKKKRKQSLTGEASLQSRNRRNEEDLAPVHILGKSGRLATRRNVPRVKRRRRTTVTVSPAWIV